MTQSVSAQLAAAFAIPEYVDENQRDVPSDPLGELPFPEPGFRLNQTPSWGTVITVRNYVLDVTYHDATGWLSVVWSVDVERPFAGMFKSLDPRNWNECSANVEVATDALATDPCPLYDPIVRNPGTSWSSHFWERLGVNGAPFCNQLYFIFSNPTAPPLIVTTFSDKDPAGNPTQLDGQIEFDRGWAAYGPAPWDSTGAWTRLRVVKYLKFTSGWVADLGVLLLRNWADEEVKSAVTCLIP